MAITPFLVVLIVAAVFVAVIPRRIGMHHEWRRLFTGLAVTLVVLVGLYPIAVVLMAWSSGAGHF